VLFLGLFLLQVLTVSQLRATIADELGHYRAGDTMLEPWICRTREAMPARVAINKAIELARTARDYTSPRALAAHRSFCPHPDAELGQRCRDRRAPESGDLVAECSVTSRQRDPVTAAADRAVTGCRPAD
jgi:hypothetical protein